MTVKNEITPDGLALNDYDRKGILIPADVLKNSPFTIGDRFSVKIGKTELYTVSIGLKENGEIFYDRSGIFIERVRRVDALLGGIFDRYAVFIEPDRPGTIKIRPLDVVIEEQD